MATLYSSCKARANALILAIPPRAGAGAPDLDLRGHLKVGDKKKGHPRPRSHSHPVPRPPHFSLCHLLRGLVFVLELKFIELFVFTAHGHEFSMNPFLNDPSLGQDEDPIHISHR